MLFIGMRYLDRDSKVLRYGLSVNLPFFVVHQPVILAIAYFVVQWEASIAFKLLVVILLFGLLLGLTTFVVRIWAPMGWWWEPLHQEPAHFPQYTGFFVVGLVAYRHSWFSRLSAAQTRPWRWVALALVPLFPALAVAAGVLSGEMDPAITGGLTWRSLAYSLWEGFMGTAMVIVMLVWCRDRFDRQGRLLRSMSAASYAVYVLHPLLIVPLALALSGVRLDLSLKFLLVAPVAVALCFLVGHGVRKLPVVRGIL
jgi:glucan biosynthesis protein C